MKPHYFNQESADTDDIFLQMAKAQQYVPQTCLLGGQVVMELVNKGESLCKGCECDRSLCKGKPKED